MEKKIAILFLLGLFAAGQIKAQDRYAFGYALDNSNRILYVTSATPLDGFKDNRYPSSINHFYWMFKYKLKLLTSMQISIIIAWNATSSNDIAYDPYQAYTQQQAIEGQNKFVNYYNNIGYSIRAIGFIYEDYNR